MRHKKLFSLLAVLSREELKRFGKFLQSPYFTESEGLVIFYDYLKQHYPAFDPEKMSLEAAYRRLFSKRLELKKPLDKKESEARKQKMLAEKLDHLLSDMFRLLETFLVVEEALFNSEKEENGKSGKESPPQLQARQSGISIREELLVKALARRTAYEFFLKYSQALLAKTEGLPVKNTDDYWLLSQLHHWMYYHPATDKLRQKTPGVLEAMRHLDASYYLSKLRYAAELSAWKQIRPTEFHIPLLEEIIREASQLVASTAQETPARQHLLLAAYLELVQLYRENEAAESRFNNARELLLRHAGALPLREKRHLFTHLSNAGIRLYNLENRPIGEDLLALYRWALQEGLLVVNRRMTDTAYLNVILLAGDCGEFAWAANFMETCKCFLEDNVAEDACRAASGYLHFAKGEFDLARQCLVPVAVNRPLYSFYTRWILLKILFEEFMKDRGLYEHLLHYDTAFEKFILYQAMGDAKKEAWLNFVRFTRKAASFRLKNGRVSKEEKRQLKAELDALKYVYSKKWLVESFSESVA